MIKKSLMLIISTLALMPVMLVIVSAVIDDTTAPVSNVLEIWDKYGGNKLGICEDNSAIAQTILSFKGEASDDLNIVVGVDLKRDADVDSVSWEDNSNWDPTTLNGYSNNIDFNSIAQFNNEPFTKGNRIVCSRAKDGAGNVEEVNLENCCMFCVDTDEPEQVENVVHANPSPSECVSNYVNVAPEFEWDEASDEGCAEIDYYEVELNGEILEEQVYDNFFTVEEPENGENYYIRVRAVDRAGNTGDWSSSSEDVYYDNEMPEVEITSTFPEGLLKEGKTWFKGNFAVSETDSDNLALFKCEYKIVNNDVTIKDWTGSKEQCNSDLNIEVPEDCEDGTCVILKKAIDNACNVGETEKEYNIDTTPPVTKKTVGEPKYLGFEFEWMDMIIDWFVKPDTKITLECADVGIGCNEDRTFYSINGNGENWIPYTEPFPIGEDDRVYVIEYQSDDLLGNMEEIKSETDKIDTEAPVSVKTEKPTYEDGENTWVSGSSNFTITAEDSESGVNKTFYRINYEEETEDSLYDGGWNEYTAPFNLENECWNENPENFIDYYSIDQLRTKEDKKSQNVMLDCVAPEILIFNPNENEREIEKCVQSVVVNVTDIGAGVKRVWAELWDENGEESVMVRSESMTLTIYGTYEALMDKQLPAGDYTLKVMAEDNVGNVNTYLIDETLNKSVFVEYISPASCSIEPAEGGKCEFTFYVCIRGGDSIKFWLDKLGGIITPGMMNASILKEGDSKYVGLLDNGIDAGLLSLSDETINGRESFNLRLNVPANVASQIGTGTHKLDYLIKSFIE